MTDQTLLRAALFAAVPDDGTSIGNQALLERLRNTSPELTEQDYWTARDALIADGQWGVMKAPLPCWSAPISSW